MPPNEAVEVGGDAPTNEESQGMDVDTAGVVDRVVYRDVMMASRHHDTMGRDEPLCHDTIGLA